VFATDLSDADSRLTSWIIGRATRQAEDDCSDVFFQGTDPAVWVAREQASRNALIFCAVDEAGLMSDPIKVELEYDAIGTPVSAESGPVAWVGEPTTLEPLVTDKPVCWSDRPSCRRATGTCACVPSTWSATCLPGRQRWFATRRYLLNRALPGARPTPTDHRTTDHVDTVVAESLVQRVLRLARATARGGLGHAVVATGDVASEALCTDCCLFCELTGVVVYVNTLDGAADHQH
jgi:hypothetical protein